MNCVYKKQTPSQGHVFTAQVIHELKMLELNKTKTNCMYMPYRRKESNGFVLG